MEEVIKGLLNTAMDKQAREHMAWWDPRNYGTPEGEAMACYDGNFNIDAVAADVAAGLAEMKAACSAEVHEPLAI